MKLIPFLALAAIPFGVGALAPEHRIVLRLSQGRSRQETGGGPPSPAYALRWADSLDGHALDTTKWDYRGLGK